MLQYEGKYVTEMSVNEVFDLFYKLRVKGQLTEDEAGMFQICKERIIEYAVAEHEKKNAAIFDSHGADEELNKYSGQRVTVVCQLTVDETDNDYIGEMYKVRFADGREATVFEDELARVHPSDAVSTNANSCAGKDDFSKYMNPPVKDETSLSHTEHVVTDFVLQVHNDMGEFLRQVDVFPDKKSAIEYVDEHELEDAYEQYHLTVIERYLNAEGDIVSTCVNEVSLEDEDVDCEVKKSESVLFASVAVYTGDGSVNAVLFTTEKEAKEDCKKQFEASLAEGKQAGDLNPHMDSIWHDDEMYGTVYWDDDNTSTFEVKAFTLHLADNVVNDDVMVIPTPAGELRVYKSEVSERPGCHVMLYPKDYSDEIDVVTVLTEENNPEDVGIYVYDNAFEEDWQLHTTLQRNEVTQALGK